MRLPRYTSATRNTSVMAVVVDRMTSLSLPIFAEWRFGRRLCPSKLESPTWKSDLFAMTAQTTSWQHWKTTRWGGWSSLDDVDACRSDVESSVSHSRRFGTVDAKHWRAWSFSAARARNNLTISYLITERVNFMLTGRVSGLCTHQSPRFPDLCITTPK